MRASVATRALSAAFLFLNCAAWVGDSAWAGDSGDIRASCSATSATCTASVSRLFEAPVQHPSIRGADEEPSSAQLDVQHLLASCRVDYLPAAAGVQFHPHVPGNWYLAPCARMAGLSAQIPVGTPLVWVPGAVRAASVLQAALTAEAMLRLPSPAVASSPGPGVGVPKVVNLPTWAWIPAAQFAPVSATATLPGVSATVTATPYAMDWVWGDGARSRCAGPGTPFVTGSDDPSRPSPDCGHVYRSTSAAAPGERFQVSASIWWRVTWSGAGQAGTLPDLASSASQPWPVEQIQSVIVG